MKDAPGLDPRDEELIAAHAAGDLEGPQRQRAVELLAGSAAARALEARLRALDAATARAWSAPELELDASTRARVAARVEHEARRFRRTRRALAGVGLAAAAALGVIVAWPLLRPHATGAPEVVATGPGQYRLLELGERAVAFVGENAELEVRPASPALFVRRGSVRLVVKTSRTEPPFIVASPAAEVAVLGTEFDVTVHGDTTEVRVTRGEVELRNAHGRRRVWPGETGHVRADQSPRYVERLKGIVLDLAPEIETHPARRPR